MKLLPLIFFLFSEQILAATYFFECHSHDHDKDLEFSLEVPAEKIEEKEFMIDFEPQQITSRIHWFSGLDIDNYKSIGYIPNLDFDRRDLDLALVAAEGLDINILDFFSKEVFAHLKDGEMVLNSYWFLGGKGDYFAEIVFPETDHLIKMICSSSENQFE